MHFLTDKLKVPCNTTTTQEGKAIPDKSKTSKFLRGIIKYLFLISLVLSIYSYVYLTALNVVDLTRSRQVFRLKVKFMKKPF